MKKRIVILGSTGSIGCQTLEVVDMFPEKFEIVGLAAGRNTARLAEQVNKYRPKAVSIGCADDVPALRSQIPGGCRVTAGITGMAELAVMDEADVVVTSITGTLGLLPTIEAIKAGKDIALANKETLVAAGELVMELVRKHRVRLLPVDSEHSAIFQCLNGASHGEVKKLILTASGGPFKYKSARELAQVTVADALNHPNWTMGRKITIDSATLMNKGLEVIEARWLFDIGLDNIQVVVHPQSIIHSMVEFVDGAVLAQLGMPDMRVPIQYALSYPARWANDFPKMDMLTAGPLTFEEPRTGVFPSLAIAFTAGRHGGTMPAVMNAANEEAVALFLEGNAGFTAIPDLVQRVMANHTVCPSPGLEDILAADAWARMEIKRYI